MPDPTQMDLKEIPESDRQKFGLKGRPIESDHHETEFQSDDQVVGDQDLSLVTHETKNINIGYVAEFKEFIKNNPGVMRTFLEIDREIAEDPKGKKGSAVEKDGIIVEVVYQNDNIGDGSLIYKVNAGGEDYFVKARRAMGPDLYNEIASSDEATRRLAEFPIPGVRVEDYQLGISAKNRVQGQYKRMYLVAKWFDGELCYDYFKRLEDKTLYQYDLHRSFEERQIKETRTEEEISADKEKMRVLAKKIDEVKALFPEYHDIGPHNFFHDSENNDLVWMDIQSEERMEEEAISKLDLAALRAYVSELPPGTIIDPREIEMLNEGDYQFYSPYVFFNKLERAGLVKRVKSPNSERLDYVFERV